MKTTMYRSDASESFKEHLHKLPNEVQRKFLNNLWNNSSTNKFNKYYQKLTFRSMDEFIISAFIFSQTPEGVDYWIGIIEKYEYNLL
jgi:hypothetical protein